VHLLAFKELHVDVPETPPLQVRPKLFEEIRDTPERLIHLVMVATKPDIIKQLPVYLELQRQGKFALLGHTGQHYDWNLSGALHEEFKVRPDFILNIRGSLYQKIAQIIERLGFVVSKIRQEAPDKVLLPYVHGDTSTAAAGGVACYNSSVPVVHVEAGLRTLTPRVILLEKLVKDEISVEDFYEQLHQRELWEKGSSEPFPEQFDTRTAAPVSGVHLAPVELNRQNLLDEGFPADRISVVGNTVSDSLQIALRKAETSRIYERYPILEEGSVVRFCVHRRGNIVSKHRFKVLFDTVIKLVENGYTVLWIALGGTFAALRAFSLEKKIRRFAEKHPSLVFSEVWPYYNDVIRVMKDCAAIATDSGSIQEEANILHVPCATLRFNSDRPETLIAGANVLAPPVTADVVFRVIQEVVENKGMNRQMRDIPNLYGEKVSAKIIDFTTQVAETQSVFRWEQERLGFSNRDDWEPGETTYL
jgi:UDP-N-acetylglucosamine 2-epimerase (non-hydrolysing)